MGAAFSDLGQVELTSARECEPTAEDQEETSRKTPFWILVLIVYAIRNFGNALNPPIDFRRRIPSEDEYVTKDSAESRRTISQRPQLVRHAYTHAKSGRLVWRTTRTTSGNKTYYLKKGLFASEPPNVNNSPFPYDRRPPEHGTAVIAVEEHMI